MSTLAEQLASAPIAEIKSRRGPVAACDIYGAGDLDDWAEVQKRRKAKSWAEAQAAVDALLGVRSIHLDKFRYHFSGKCGHWTAEQYAAIRAAQ